MNIAIIENNLQIAPPTKTLPNRHRPSTTVKKLRLEIQNFETLDLSIATNIFTSLQEIILVELDQQLRNLTFVYPINYPQTEKVKIRFNKSGTRLQRILQNTCPCDIFRMSFFFAFENLDLLALEGPFQRANAKKSELNLHPVQCTVCM